MNKWTTMKHSTCWMKSNFRKRVIIMYKPQYLNVERVKNNVMAGNTVYFTKVISTPLGYKKKPPEQIQNKSGRRFAGK